MSLPLYSFWEVQIPSVAIRAKAQYFLVSPLTRSRIRTEPRLASFRSCSLINNRAVRIAQWAQRDIDGDDRVHSYLRPPPPPPRRHAGANKYPNSTFSYHRDTSTYFRTVVCVPGERIAARSAGITERTVQAPCLGARNSTI